MNKLIIVFIGMLVFSPFLFSQTTDSIIYLGNDYNFPWPKDGISEIQTNIRAGIPDSINFKNLTDKPIFSIKILKSYVDSVLILKSSGNDTLDKYIEIGLKKTKFIYPDTLFGYPSTRWISIPIETNQLLKKKSIWESLKFW